MKEIELEIPIDEMDEGDLRATFAEVMEAHEENVKEFRELEEQLDEAADYSEQVEQLEDELETAKAYFAEKGEGVTGIQKDLLVDRFALEELVQFAEKADEEAAEFAEEADEADEDEEADFSDDEEEAEESIFADRPSKVGDFSADQFEDRKEAAKSRLSGIGGIALD